MTLQEKAEIIVGQIIDDLCDRKGFDLRSLDEEIFNEIRETWIEFVVAGMQGEAAYDENIPPYIFIL